MSLVLLPNKLSDKMGGDKNSFKREVSPRVFEEVALIDGLYAEDAKKGRAFLKMCGRSPREVSMLLLNHHTKWE